MPCTGRGAGLSLHVVDFCKTEKNCENFYILKPSAGPDYGIVGRKCGRNLVLPWVLGGIHNINGIDKFYYIWAYGATQNSTFGFF